MLGIYVHIPYCLRKCAYCDFASLPLAEAGGLAAARRYMDAVAIELDRRALSEEFLGCEVDTVYIGGGTPTVLPPEWLAELLDHLRLRFALRPDAEVTVEANPGTVDEAKIGALLEAGVNRISLGVQSFADPVLQTLGRIHSAAEAQHAIAAARAAGCANLGLDLMYGIPNQSPEQWRSSLEIAAEAQPDHVSVYALSVEPGTRLCEVIAAHALPPPDEDLAADMYLAAQELLGKAGFDHYEISNFAQPTESRIHGHIHGRSANRPGCSSLRDSAIARKTYRASLNDRQCRHNRRYWAHDEYLGIGAASHTFRRGVRWNNLPDPAVYTQWVEAGQLPVARAEALSAR